MIAYGLILLLVLAAAVGIAYVMYNRRDRRVARDRLREAKGRDAQL
jgi:hypothetical protein